MTALNLSEAARALLSRFPLELKRLTSADFAAVIALQGRVVAQLVDLDSYEPLTALELNQVLSGSGLAVGLWSGTLLVGFYSGLYPCPYADLLAAACVARREQAQSAYILAIFIHPDWRRKGLQRIMGKALVAEMQRLWTVNHLLVVVAPGNVASIREQLAHGMAAVQLRELFGGKKRLVFYRSMDSGGEASDAGHRESIPLTEIAALSAALAAGYRGIDLAENVQGICMVLSRP